MQRITKFLTMLALLTTVATGAWAATIDLSTLKANYEAQDGDVLTGTLGKNVKISIADGATVTLSGATITNLGNGCDWAGINCPGDATLVLKGTNTVCAGLDGYGENNYPGIWIANGKTLTIQGDGSLTAYSNETDPYSAGIGGGYYIDCGNIVIEGGTITATGGTAAAGIGGGQGGSCGDITITDGVTCVTATKGDGAIYSIGAGTNANGSSGTVGTVTIGGVVGGISESPYTYMGKDETPALTLSDTEDNSAALAEYDGQVADVTLSGRTLYKDGAWNTLTLPFSVDISGSVLKGATAKTLSSTAYDSETQTLTLNFGEAVSTLEAGKPYIIKWAGRSSIPGNTVDLSKLTTKYVAQDGDVLTGTLSANVKISVANGATVTLDGVTINGWNDEDDKYDVDDEDDLMYGWAGINCPGDATIILSGENTVTAFDIYFPGIYIAQGKTLTIRGNGSLNASSYCYGAGIGGAAYGYANCGNIVIEGGTINATGYENYGGAGIGSGISGHCGDITITGGTINATGTYYAPGIGSGSYGFCGDITITNGVTRVTATAGQYAKNSIGADYRGSCGTVTIGSTVTVSIPISPYTYTGNGTGGYIDDGSDLVSPVFKGVTISNKTANVSTTYADFTGSFSPTTISGEDKTMLYLSADNTLYYPNAAMQIGSCCAYFQLNEGLYGGEPAAAGVRAFVLNFFDEQSGEAERGDGETTGVTTTNRTDSTSEAGAWYSLDGRRLTGKPTQRGIYVKGGKKIVIK